MLCHHASQLLVVLVLAALLEGFPSPATAFLPQQQRPRSGHSRWQPVSWPRSCRHPPCSPPQHLPVSLSLAGDSSVNNSDDGSGVTWNNAKVVSTKPACPSGKSLLWSIQLDTGDVPSLGYTTPGQFLKLRWNETTDPLFLAMCSPPPSSDDNDDKKETLEFLVKTTPNIPWLIDIQEDDTVQVSNVMGNGFAAATEALKENSKGDDDSSSSDETDDSIDHMLLVAAGSGIAPLMACFRTKEWLDKVTYGTVYYGEWTVDDICFQDELATEEAGINLVPCFSRQERDFTKGFWSGHVQMVMWQRGVINPEKTVALVCGPNDMTDDVRQLLTRAGVKPERIVTNV